MDGFERRRQQKKDDILNASLELFKQYGYNKVSIAEIAKKASVSQVSIYNFFGSKDNLKKELLRKLLNEHINKTVEILGTPDPVKIKLERLLMTRIEYFKSFTANFIVEIMSESTFIEEFMKSEDYEKVMRSMYNLLDEGKREGVFDASISSEAMVVYIETFQSYLINNPSFITKLEQNSEFAKEIFNLFINGLIKK